MHAHHEFTPNFLPFQITKRRLTSAAGLATLIEAFDQSTLKKPFCEALPERTSPRSLGSYRLGVIQLASFMRGHDCLADIEEFRKDPVLMEVLRGDIVSPRTMGDFLRDFEEPNLAAFNSFLSRQARAYRQQLHKMLKKQFKPALAPHLSIDSTAHVQSGVKMEGLAYNYKDQWCLDSQVIFDELGMAWDMELRPGNTKSGTGAVLRSGALLPPTSSRMRNIFPETRLTATRSASPQVSAWVLFFRSQPIKPRPAGKITSIQSSNGSHGSIRKTRSKRRRSLAAHFRRSSSAGSIGNRVGTRPCALRSW
ncbi:MAG: hypothetical protein HC902_13895 [Calothrix sp. SM1_5_4]|nr:hypothetical protein [Calothrix sp. SM1_5_4]